MKAFGAEHLGYLETQFVVMGLVDNDGRVISDEDAVAHVRREALPAGRRGDRRHRALPEHDPALRAGRGAPPRALLRVRRRPQGPVGGPQHGRHRGERLRLPVALPRDVPPDARPLPDARAVDPRRRDGRPRPAHPRHASPRRFEDRPRGQPDLGSRDAPPPSADAPGLGRGEPDLEPAARLRPGPVGAPLPGVPEDRRARVPQYRRPRDVGLEHDRRVLHGGHALPPIVGRDPLDRQGLALALVRPARGEGAPPLRLRAPDRGVRGALRRGPLDSALGALASVKPVSYGYAKRTWGLDFN